MSNRQLTKLRIAANIFPKVQKYRWFGVPTPLLVTFGITNKCNLRCPYCFAGLDNRQGMEMPTEKILDYIDQFRDLGAQEINLQGGEPSLHPDIDKIVHHVVDNGMHCSMATNGIGVSSKWHKRERNLKAFKKCYMIGVSLDGGQETTDRNRGLGAYAVAREAIEVLSEHEVNVRIHGVITAIHTKDDIKHLVDLAETFKTSVNFVYAVESGNNEIDTLTETGFPERAKQLMLYMKELKAGGAPITSKEGAINQVLNWPHDPQKILMEDEMTPDEYAELKALGIPRCLWGNLAVFFNTDGKLYLCPRGFDREGFYVDIGNKTIAEAFHELSRKRKCYQCGQMGDLSYSFGLNKDNMQTWLKY